MAKLTVAQIKALRNLRDTGQPTFGIRSKQAQRLRDGLVQLGLMTEARSPRELPKLTDAGRGALADAAGE